MDHGRLVMVDVTMTGRAVASCVSALEFAAQGGMSIPAEQAQGYLDALAACKRALLAAAATAVERSADADNSLPRIDPAWSLDLQHPRFVEDGSQKAGILVAYPLGATTARKIRARTTPSGRLLVELEGPRLCKACGREECDRGHHTPDYAPPEVFVLSLEPVASR